MKNLFLFILIILINFSSYSQEYEIKVKINGVSDTTIYLGHYFGNKTYIIDTAQTDNYGHAIFDGNQKLKRGLYFIAIPTPGMSYFEFLMTDNQKFSIETSRPDYYRNMKFENSADNELFLEYQKQITELTRKQFMLDRELKSAKNYPKAKEEMAKKMLEISNERKEIIKSIINKSPESLLGKILNAMLDVEIPEPPKDQDGNIIDPNFNYYYLKEHFFDNIDFSEEGLVRTPVYEGKLDYYMQSMVVQTPDSLIKEANLIINKTYEAGDSIMFQYTLSHLLNFYDTSRIMGFDAVFAAIAEDWYLSGKAYWADSIYLVKVAERVNKITPTKIGNVAYNLDRMQSNDGKYYNLHNISGDYTILIFWEPNCGTCKRIVPELMKEFRDTLKSLNVNVFAVYTQYNQNEWNQFITDKNLSEEGWYNVWDGPYPHSRFANYYDIYSTPVIYILDNQKKIIGKRISVNKILNLINFDRKKKN